MAYGKTCKKGTFSCHYKMYPLMGVHWLGLQPSKPIDLQVQSTEQVKKPLIGQVAIYLSSWLTVQGSFGPKSWALLYFPLWVLGGVVTGR